MSGFQQDIDRVHVLNELESSEREMSDVAELWSSCSSTLREQVPEPAWNAWLAPLVALEVSGARVVLAAPSTFIKEMVLSRFEGLIQQVLSETARIPIEDLELVVQAGLPPTPDLASQVPASSADLSQRAALVQPHPEVVPQATFATHAPSSLPPQQAPGVSGTANQSSKPLGALSGAQLAPPGQLLRPDRRLQPTLNPRYSFEAFVTGESNRFAYAAAQRVAEEPARAYNPLFVYGDSGLGKTHLLHAIGNYVVLQFPQLHVCYVSTETFLNDFIEAIRTKGQTAFKRRYRTYDVLLVDDVQLLENKQETQEEFFYTFNSLYEAEKQLVLSSDRHPRSIATLEDRLRSRFESGLITDVQPPELETRLAILRKKAEGEKVPVPDDVLELIATHVKDNIRELEGALIRLAAFASIHQVPVTLQLAQRVLAEVLAASAPRQVSTNQILEHVAKAYNFSVEEICGPSRSRPLVAARQMAMYLMRELTDYSFPEIAKALGNRDHTTVIHGWRKIGSQIGEKRALYDQVTELMHKIRAAE
ncbi:MAG: chromosomal replication initiator protein DnaA [Actinobacteria bacterium]|nr:chromosomal replication initiator protein DnaA [Actinomycetota bacterium]